MAGETNDGDNEDEKTVDHHIRKSSGTSGNEELVKFIRAGVTKDDHKSGEKAASKIRGPVRKMESKADRTVKDQIFCHVGGFPHRETHEFDEVGILRRIPAEKAEFRPDQQDQSAHGIAHFRGFDGRL